jgi:hypothetical protein
MKILTFYALCALSIITAPISFKAIVFAGKQMNSPEVWLTSNGEVIKIIGNDGELLPWTDDLDQFENGYTSVFVDSSLCKYSYYPSKDIWND